VNNDSDTNFLALLETLDPPARKLIDAAITSISVKPRQYIYQQGDVADAVYIVVSGAVEAVTFSPDGKQSRSVALMSAGDFFGDLAIFTHNQRLAAVRACAATELYRIDKEAFIRLLKTVPELGFFFSHHLAHRLHRTSTEAHLNVYAIDLMGNLQRFDLLTIVQAITGMGHTGELRLNNSANQLLGSFFFRNGRVEHARFDHLLGLEAIWQGFIESTSEGAFSFRSVEEPTLPFPEENKIDLDSTNLLLEGVGKRDTYQNFPETLRKMQGRLARIAESLDWKNDENRVVAEQIWALIAEPQPLSKVWLKLNYSAISLLEVVMEMGMNGQAELFIEATGEAK
jgi:CRP-like cAMP-binding protein